MDSLVYAGPESLTATTAYDGLGRITGYAEYAGGQLVYNRSAIVYNARGQVYSEASYLRTNYSDSALN